MSYLQNNNMWLLLLKGKGFVATLYAAVVVDKVRWQSK